MNILGISAYYHDSAAVLLNDGQIIAAAQEERFTRIKHDPSFPMSAIKFCIDYSEIDASEIDLVVFYEKPLLKFKRIMSTYLQSAPQGFNSFTKAIPLWFGNKLFQKSHIIKSMATFDSNVNWQDRLIFSEHHLSHAASAFYPSPFSEAAILTLDGVGEWTSSSVMIGDKNILTPLYEINFPHSLGLLYSAFTYYLGFKVNSGEYKMMGLAPYGQPRFFDKILKELVDVKPDGSYRLNLHYFNYCTGLTMVNQRFENLFGAPRRLANDEITAFHMDIAASVQEALEYIVLLTGQHIHKQTNQKNLCLAGGVALNCVANGKLLRAQLFDTIWIQPASGDAGGALGASLVGYHLYKRKKRHVKKNDTMQGSYLGPEYTEDETKSALKKLGACYHKLTESQLLDCVVDSLVKRMSIGWFQGRMEFGPRALGCRSIIADPRDPNMQKLLNLKIKFRESFRPFAPSILADYVSDWFDLDVDSPYMLFVANVQKSRQIERDNKNKQGIDLLNEIRSEIPAVTHVDYSARIQTVHRETNPLYYKLIEKFYQKTGCPVLINTSFNIRGEPIVNTPENAFQCFMGTNLDVLAVNNYVMFKSEQKGNLLKNYKHQFALD